MSTTPPTPANKAKQIEPDAAILLSYLEAYTPADKFGPAVVIITTDDIIAALGPMADISRASVNNALISLGFRPGRNTAGSFGWMMKTANS